MNKIQAILIQEERGFTASNKLLRSALERAGFDDVKTVPAEPPVPITWKEEEPVQTVIFLGSLLQSPISAERWAEYIKEAICHGAGLVAMLDGSTAGVLSKLSAKLEACKDPKVRLPITWFDEVKDITFRPILTADGKNHEAMKLLTDKVLPPFGSINRSYYRMLARNDGQTKVLMEIPEYLDQKPIIPPAWVKDGSPNDKEYVVGQAYPFVVVRKPIAVMAADWCNTGGREFVRWQHASIWLASLACAATGLKMEELKPRSIKPSYWFLNCDRQETVPNWCRIKGKLSTPVEAPTDPAAGSVRAKLTPGETYEQLCGEPPLILSQEKDNFLEAKLCNGIVVRLNKNAMQAGYRLDPPAGNKIVLAEDSSESKPTHKLLPWKCAEYKGPLRIEGSALTVTYDLFDCKNNQTGTLFWTFTPAVKEIEGTTWYCVGEKFTLSTDVNVQHFISPPHKWRLGGRIDDLWTRRFACYGAKRGFLQTRFNQETTSEPFYWFHSGQPFQMLTYEGREEARTLWCYATEPACIRSEMRRLPACDYVDLDLQVPLGLQKGPIELPTFWYCFAEHGFDHNLWLAAYDYVRQQIRSHCGIERMYPRPTAMLRYNITYLNDLNSYADAFVPLAKELGFKRIDCGVRYVNDLFFPLHGGIEALRDLCQKAHDAGIEVIFYCGASWHHDGEPKLGDGKQRDCSTEPHLVSKMIEDSWRIKNKDGENIVWKNPDDQSECHTADGLKRKIILLGLDTDWYDVSLGRYDCLKEQTRYSEPAAHDADATEYPGVSGVWLDSWSIPNHPDYVNYAKTPDRPTVPTVSKALNYVAKLQNKGYLVLVEGQSPVALDSFWYQEEKYEPMVGNEFCMSGMSPFASNGDGLLGLDLFRLLAYGCAMFQDIRLLTDANNEVTKLAKSCNKMMNLIHEKLGMPQRIRELSIIKINAQSPAAAIRECEEDIENAPIGTFWECEKGIAIFGLRSANHLRIDLPSIMSSHVLVEQHNIRSPEGTTNMQIPTEDSQSEGGQVYLEGQLAAGGVAIIQAAWGDESTDIWLSNRACLELTGSC